MGQEPLLARHAQSIRVCHLTSGPLSGGAARGALALHQALLAAGLDSTLVTDVVGGSPGAGVVQLPAVVHPKVDQAARRSLDQLPVKLYRRRFGALFTPAISGRSIQRIAAAMTADVINLHWVGGGLVSMRSLRRVRAPVVWTLRDLWPATGGCHYPSIHDCDRFEHECGRCPHLNSRLQWDLSHLTWRNKLRSLPRDLTVVGISTWVAEEARRSSLFRDREILAIPNCIDTDTFAPVDRATARRILGLPEDVKLVLAGALNPADPYKGWPLLLQALARTTHDCRTIMFGDTTVAQLGAVPRLLSGFGHVSDDLKLRLLYAAADVYVSAATNEAFGKTIAESLSCGTPAVVFSAAGPKDIVSHQESGYLATPFDPESLAAGIDWVLSHPDPDALSRAGRRRAEARFSKPVAAQAYLDLYRRLLNRAR
jgi:glycosyltransferase involved in cell wall biosynthesis